MPAVSISYPEQAPPLLDGLNKELLLDRASCTDDTQFGLRLYTPLNGRDVLRHPDFQTILENLRPGYSYFAQTWHGALSLEI